MPGSRLLPVAEFEARANGIQSNGLQFSPKVPAEFLGALAP